MALVRCNHCGKETKNDTEKCRWCNKELDKNLDVIVNKWLNIENKVKEEKNLKEKKYKEDNFWICIECQEENELNIEVCWKCQTIDKQNNSQKIKRSQSNIEKNDEINLLSIQLIDELRSTRKIKSLIYIIGFLTVLVIFSAILSIPFGDYKNDFLVPIAAGIIFYPYNILYKRFINIPLSKSYREKAIKKLGLENHKYINEINDVVKNSSVGIDH